MKGKKSGAKILAIVLLGGILLSCGGGVNVGKNAPPFELSDLDGNIVSLSGFKDKIVLLNFWGYT